MGAIACTVLRFVQAAILARMLEPKDFGLMAIVISVTTFMQVFADLGVSTAIIHYQDISSEQLSSLYWLNVMIGATLTLSMAAASPWIGTIVFHEPALQPILMLISINFLFLALGQQLRVRAEKALQFPVLARVDVLATVGGCSAAILWAVCSATVYALVAGVLINGFLQALLVWLLASQGWRPAFRFRLTEVRRFLKFGTYIVGGNLLNNLSRQADILIGGRIFPAATLGSYSLPRNLSLNIVGVTNPIVTRVALPVMAKAQEDRAFLKSVYLKTTRMTASVNFPIFLACAVFSKEVVLLIFGAKWISSVPLLVYLAFYGMLRSCINPVGSLLYAVGQAHMQFRWDLASSLLVFPTLWAASHMGIVGLAAGQVLLMGGLLIPKWYFLVRPHCDAGLGEYLLTLLSPLVAALFAVLVGYIAVSHLTSPLMRLGAMVLIVTPLYAAASWVVNRSWMMAMLQLILRR
jgi:O-antigen/teichoic acid export membrane protein